MKIRLSIVLVLAVCFMIGGCASARMSQSVRSNYQGPPIDVIAFAPGGGAFADAVGVELFNRGLTIIDPEQTVGILGHVGIAQIQIASPESYAALREAGVEGLLVVKAVMSDDGTPEGASVRLTSTTTSEVVAGLTWQNGWGGRRGSIADRSMRKNLATAAAQIADELMARVQ